MKNAFQWAVANLLALRKKSKTSRYKIFLRAWIFLNLLGLFGFYLVRDVRAGYFQWLWVAILFVAFIPVGFFLSRFTPMTTNPERGEVVLSMDKLYIALIWILVGVKLWASHHPETIPWADTIMCIILGVMGGRLGGIGLRVRKLKNEMAEAAVSEAAEGQEFSS